MTKLALLPVCLLACLSARGGIYSDFATDAEISVVYKLRDGSFECQTVSRRDATGRAVPFAFSDDCYVMAASDHWIVHLENTSFEGGIYAGGGLEIQLAGTSSISKTDSTTPGTWGKTRAIQATGGLCILGPGSLGIYHTQSTSAIHVESGDLYVQGGAILDILGAEASDGGFFCRGTISVSDSVVRVANYATGLVDDCHAIECYGALSVDKSVVSCSSYGSAICVRTGVTAARSCIHAVSGLGNGIDSSGTASFSFRDGVLCVFGGNHGIRMSGADTDPPQTLSFSRIAGAIAGEWSGITGAPNVLFQNSDLAIAGNAHGYRSYSRSYAATGDTGRGQGVYIRNQVSGSGTFRQVGGTVRIRAAGHVGVVANTTALEGGTLEIGGDLRASDFAAYFSPETARRVLSDVADGFALFDSLSRLEEWAADDFDCWMTDDLPVSSGDPGIPAVGHAGGNFTVSDGRAVVSGSEVGLLLNRGVLSVSGGRIDASSTGTAVADSISWNRTRTFFLSSGSTDAGSEIAISGGMLTCRGGTNAVVLAGGIRQTGGTLHTSMTGGVSASETSEWPCCRGANVKTGGGHAITGGSFLPSVGGGYAPPKTDAAHGSVATYPCKLAVAGDGPAVVSSMVPSWYGTKDLYPVNGAVWPWLPVGAASLTSGETAYQANDSGSVEARYDNAFVAAGTVVPAAPSPVHRFWSPVSRTHFYTMSEAEKDDLVRNRAGTWTYEGVAYYAFDRQAAGTTPLFRFYSRTNRTHFYTMSASERDSLKKNANWSYEGVGFYVYPSGQSGDPGRIPVFRFWSGAYRHHFYTTSVAERDNLRKNANWSYEGIAFYALKPIYRVPLQAEGGSGGTTSVDATYGAPMPAITPPVRADHVFNGYYDHVDDERREYGTKYYDATGTGVRNWDSLGSRPLYASWTAAVESGSLQPVYRLYSTSTGRHFFTMNAGEKDSLAAGKVWRYEGVAYYAYPNYVRGSTPLYRFYSPANKAHFFTVSESEKNSLGKNANWRFEGIAFFVSTGAQSGTTPVYRFWSLSKNYHFFTTSAAERDNLQANRNWRYEGTGFHAWRSSSGGDVTCIVTFDANGGRVSETSRSVKPGAAVGTLPAPSRDGFDFAGWYTAASGGSRVSATTRITASATFWAHWTKQSSRPVSSLRIESPRGDSVSCDSVWSGTCMAFGCIATRTDGSEERVSPVWSISSGADAGTIRSIRGFGVFKTEGTMQERRVTISASFGGKTATKGVLVLPLDQFYGDYPIYVDAATGNDANDGMTPETAKRTIQAAVDLVPQWGALDFDLYDYVILVNDGIYGPIDTEGRAVHIASVHGPERTIIDGNRSARCATLSDTTTTRTMPWYADPEASRRTRLSGFTLRNGYLEAASELSDETYAAAYGAGVFGGVLVDCILRDNRTVSGSGTPSACGGGAYGAKLTRCLIEDNAAGGLGGGVYRGELVDCIVRGNSASGNGGGAANADLFQCLVVDNEAGGKGGGARDSRLRQCTVSRNVAETHGGVSFISRSEGASIPNGVSTNVANCIIWGNSATGESAGADVLDLYTIVFTCSPELSGNGNVSDAPQFVDPDNGDFRLSKCSPCIDAGTVSGVPEFNPEDEFEEEEPDYSDFAGLPRFVGETVDMGCLEFNPGVDPSDWEGLSSDDVATCVWLGVLDE